MAMFLSLDLRKSRYLKQGLYQPHTGKATMPRTGTLPPTSCGKGPKAAGESVMVLPGIPSNGCPQGLRRKGSDLQCSVQSRRSSLSTGKPCTWRRAAVAGLQGRTEEGAVRLKDTSPLSFEFATVHKDILRGKAGCLERGLSGLGGGSMKPTDRKIKKAHRFYPHVRPFGYHDTVSQQLTKAREGALS
jgi:hypothetical protein